ncbi:hypothetical protein JCM11641_001882 [Rhodosporidiobolus odoratus]
MFLITSNIVASFFRSNFAQDKVPDLSGKTFVVTGGSNGIGLSTSRTLYSHGGRVILLSSQASTGEQAVAYITTGDLDKAPHDYKAGFGTQRDNSANGATKDGSVEHIVADFGDFVSTTSLADSGEMHRFTFGGPTEQYGGAKFADQEEFKKDVGPTALYARTKLGDILIVKALVEKYFQPPSKILAFSVHPGGVATGQQEQFKAAYGETVGAISSTLFRPLFRAPDDGALSTLFAATAPVVRQGKEFYNGAYFTDPEQDGKESKEATDVEPRENFWRTSLEIIKKVVGAENVGTFA